MMLTLRSIFQFCHANNKQVIIPNCTRHRMITYTNTVYIPNLDIQVPDPGLDPEHITAECRNRGPVRERERVPIRTLTIRAIQCVYK
jgi:hypothetical protein